MKTLFSNIITGALALMSLQANADELQDLKKIIAIQQAQIASLGSTIQPAGIVAAFAGVTTPAGFLPCDGRSVSKTQYAKLFSAIGETYNTQINPTTGSPWTTPNQGEFRLPDYRGTFLRAAGAPSGPRSVGLGEFQIDATAANGLSNHPVGVTLTSSGSTNVTGEHTHHMAIGSVFNPLFKVRPTLQALRKYRSMCSTSLDFRSDCGLNSLWTSSTLHDARRFRFPESTGPAT